METPAAATVGLAQYIGHVVPVTYDPGQLVLSYIVSFVGAVSTLELINRRTSRKGYYNNLLLLGASITMGGVAIWCMHYIGNQAIRLLGGEPELQIVYSARMTAASFFVPILVLLIAFFVVTGNNNNSTEVSWWRVGVSGTLSGGAICGMHYLGNASISNYHCDYAVGNVAGSAVIAAAASTVALALFFVFRSAWTGSWWKRIGCAVVLAGAVSGMHWCAALGTRYTLLVVNEVGEYGPRNTTSVVISCLSISAFLIIVGTTIYSARIRKGYAARAQRITLAAAVFDKQGRILVTPDGLLPSEVVTSSFLQKMTQHLCTLPHRGRNPRMGIDLVDQQGRVIDNYDTIFCELFCLAAASLAAKLNENLIDLGFLWDEILATGRHTTTPSMSLDENSAGPYPSKTAAETTIQNLDDVAEKGIAPNRTKTRGHGYLMFLVRRVDDNHAIEQLTAAGYRFAEPHQVSHIIASQMQIRAPRLELKMRGMERYAQGAMLNPGVHVGLFAVRTKVHQAGFDVLVRTQARNLLPSVELPGLDRLEPGHVAMLREMDGMTLSAVLHRLGSSYAGKVGLGNSAQASNFGALLYDAIRSLRSMVDDPVVDKAKLVAKVAQVPCASTAKSGGRPATCAFVAFTIMIPIHVAIISPDHEFIPLPFFKTQQLAYENSPHNAVFARSLHRKISALSHGEAKPVTRNTLLPSTGFRGYLEVMRSKIFSSSSNRPVIRRAASQGRLWRQNSGRDSPSSRHITLKPGNESDISLAPYGGNSGDPELGSDAVVPEPDTLSKSSGVGSEYGGKSSSRGPGPGLHPSKSSMGGIMISQEVTVDVEEDLASDGNTGVAQQQKSQRALRDLVGGKVQNLPSLDPNTVPVVLGPGMGTSRVEVKKEGDAVLTFVDELFATCLESGQAGRL
ncbi:hypothetical protein N656DRAFT_708468 [Canariomyces notabilis]|uniref:MHYT domain-containing protein n=1 Tax=Canariomyces notabilis TaxID=2074819 RepID=A0AAN6TF15_9PEZI|nr:hypothetical protein N656DRAFT_708468 [Canariomyces arenarius]